MRSQCGEKMIIRKNAGVYKSCSLKSRGERKKEKRKMRKVQSLAVLEISNADIECLIGETTA